MKIIGDDFNAETDNDIELSCKNNFLLDKTNYRDE